MLECSILKDRATMQSKGKRVWRWRCACQRRGGAPKLWTAVVCVCVCPFQVFRVARGKRVRTHVPWCARNRLWFHCIQRTCVGGGCHPHAAREAHDSWCTYARGGLHGTSWSWWPLGRRSLSRRADTHGVSECGDSTTSRISTGTRFTWQLWLSVAVRAHEAAVRLARCCAAVSPSGGFFDVECGGRHCWFTRAGGWAGYEPRAMQAREL